MSLPQVAPSPPSADAAVPAITSPTDSKLEDEQKLLEEKMEAPPELSPRSTSLQSPTAASTGSPSANPQKLPPKKFSKKLKLVFTSIFKCGACGSDHREVPVRDSVHPHPASPSVATSAQDTSTVSTAATAAPGPAPTVPDQEADESEPSSSALASIVTQVAQGQTAPTISTSDEDGAPQEVPQQSEPVGAKALLTPLAPEDVGRKCLVLDLDETLVHSSFKAIPHPDFIVPVEIDGQIHHAYVLKRPGVDTFLQRLGPQFEMVVFTASVAKYADPVLDLLDTHKVIKHRLFRDACIMYRGNYVKDLSQLGRDIKDVIIIDNSPASYVFHPTNAIPITTWFNDPNDTELLDLIPFLEDLKMVDNVMLVLDNNGFDDQ